MPGSNTIWQATESTFGIVNGDPVLVHWDVVDILRVLSDTYRMRAYMTLKYYQIESELSRSLSMFEIIELSNEKKKKEER